LENLAVRADGSILVTVLNHKQLWYVPAPDGGPPVTRYRCTSITSRSRMAAQRASRRRSFSHDPARFVCSAHNAAVREVPNDHAHGRVFVSGDAFEAPKLVDVLKVFWSRHGGH
jgi:hypothetical protein